MLRTLPLVLAAAFCAGGIDQASASGPLALAAGQGISVSGTDVVCAYGGPANGLGIACLHTGQKGRAYSFRISETELLAYRNGSASPVRLGDWKQPASSYSEPRSKAISNFKLVGKLSVGSHFVATRTDLGCTIYSFNSRTEVACFKLNPQGSPLDNSYAVALDSRGLQVSKFQAGRGTTVFVAGPSK